MYTYNFKDDKNEQIILPGRQNIFHLISMIELKI